MDILPLHPKIVHLPLALSMILPILGGVIALGWWRGWLARRTWLIAAALHALMSFSALVAMQTGESEEERVERVVDHEHIEEHEEAAERFLWASVVALLLAIGAAVSQDERKALALAGATVLVAFVSGALAIEVGEEGGELVYKHGAAKAYTDPLPSEDDSDGHHDEGH
jgi:uncharacterized membrane protein